MAKKFPIDVLAKKEHAKEKDRARPALFAARVALPAPPPQKKSGRGGYRGGHRKKTLPDGARIYSLNVTDEEREIVKGIVRAVRLRSREFDKIKNLVSLLENKENSIDNLVSLIH